MVFRPALNQSLELSCWIVEVSCRIMLRRSKKNLPCKCAPSFNNTTILRILEERFRSFEGKVVCRGLAQVIETGLFNHQQDHSPSIQPHQADERTYTEVKNTSD
jgi:hypothetical protein